jgi:hypothetical protein
LVVVEVMTKLPSPSKIPAAYAIGLSSGGSEQARHVFEHDEGGRELLDRVGDVIPQPPFIDMAAAASRRTKRLAREPRGQDLYRLRRSPVDLGDVPEVLYRGEPVGQDGGGTGVVVCDPCQFPAEYRLNC